MLVTVRSMRHGVLTSRRVIVLHLSTAPGASGMAPQTGRPHSALPPHHSSATSAASWHAGATAWVRQGLCRGLAAAAAAGCALSLALAPAPAWAEQATHVAAPVAAAVAEAPVDVMKSPPQLKRRASELSADELNNIRIFQENTPSVVNITNIRAVQGSAFRLDVQKIPAGVGSGFIWDTEGHVVTNFHVIAGASEVQVTLIDQTTCRAKVVGADPDKDVAVLQLDMPGKLMASLRPVMLGSSEDLLVGQHTYAIGNPFGLDHTLTSGIISGLGRELSTGLSSIKNVIQTDAAINPGNSGGVLLDGQGRVIGICTAIADPTGKGANSGVGFAIPITDVKGLVQQILTTGRVQRPALGISIAPPQILQQLGIEGVLVLDVPDGSPAAQAGMRGTVREYGSLVLGDVITRIDGKRIATYKDMFGVLDERKVGDKIKVEVLRGGIKKQTLEVVLGERQLGLAE